MSEIKTYMLVILVQAISSGMILLSKAAFNHGMKVSVFVFYRQALGTLVSIPFAMYLERDREALSLKNFCKIFAISFIGITLALNVYGIALVFTSASLGTAASNVLPVTTFAIAVLLRMESVNIRTVPGMAKVGGLIICLTGVTTFAFYKGPEFRPFFNLPWQVHEHHPAHSHVASKWVLGCFLLLLVSFCWALWLILQVQMMKIYPWKLTFTTLQCFSSAVQSFFVAIAFERDIKGWKLGWNVDLLAIAYCGILVNGVLYYFQAWLIEKKGAVYFAMTSPLCVAMTTLGSFFLLGEVLTLGTILGSIFLVISLYTVIWGKTKEEKQKEFVKTTVYDQEMCLDKP